MKNSKTTPMLYSALRRQLSAHLIKRHGAMHNIVLDACTIWAWAYQKMTLKHIAGIN